MIVKLQKIISCSSEHPDFPATNLLHIPPPGPWKCAKPAELLTTITFALPEPTSIIGLDIGNFRSCIVIVTGSTSAEPEKRIPIINHQFMTHDEAVNNKFKDQVQLFTKNELNADILKIKFDRVEVTCMQSANLRELFGLSFFILRTEVVIDMGIDVFGRFKLKNEKTEKAKLDFKEKYLRLFPEKQRSFKDNLVEKMKDKTADKFNKRLDEERTPKKRPLLEKLEAGKSEEVFGKKTPKDNSINTINSSTANGELNDVIRTPFGDIVQSNVKNKIPESKKKLDNEKLIKKKQASNDESDDRMGKAGPSRQHSENRTNQFLSKPINTPKRKLLDNEKQDDDEKVSSNNAKCTECLKNMQNQICKACKKLPPPIPKLNTSPPKKPKVVVASKIAFSKLLEDVKFSLSGYINPQRDEIRRKALKMGARYVADPNTTNNKCTHLICAFNNTPKFQQLKGHAKIVSHTFIEECFDHKKRYPWRRYALINNDKKQPESEEEIEGSISPARPPNPYDQDTEDSDTDY